MALDLVAAEVRRRRSCLGFDAFGDYPQAQAVTQIDDGANDHLIVEILLEVLDEATGRFSAAAPGAA